MVRYVSSGYRDYSTQTRSPYIRRLWEFQAIVAGTCYLTDNSGKTRIPAPSLVVSTPDYSHNWWAAAGDGCRILVIHFESVPNLLEGCFSGKEREIFPLEQEDLRFLEGGIEDVQKVFRRPGLLAPLVYQREELNLSIWLMRRYNLIPEDIHPRKHSFDRQVVDNALFCFTNRLSEGIGVKEVAREMHYSESHLRRLFQNVLGKSPRRVFLDKKLEHAKAYLLNTDQSITWIALSCGFSETSAFTHAFKNRFGMPPLKYRQEGRK